VLSAHIGVYQHEKGTSQRVRINLELTCTEHPAINDDLGNVVNYAEIVTEIRGIVGAGHINLVETLADRIAQTCLGDRRVQSAKVRIEKLEVFKRPKASAWRSSAAGNPWGENPWGGNLWGGSPPGGKPRAAIPDDALQQGQRRDIGVTVKN